MEELKLMVSDVNLRQAGQKGSILTILCTVVLFGLGFTLNSCEACKPGGLADQQHHQL
jgi:hypothetical protein